MIVDLLDKINALPPMPFVAKKATEVIKDPRSSMVDLANVVKLDSALSAIVIQWANSAYYSPRYSITSIEQAVNFLGQRTVQNLVLSASLASFMSRPLPGYDLARGDLWKHSIGTAAASKLIMQNIQPEQAEDAYYVGLFCDVGKLAFDVLLQKGILNQRVIQVNPIRPRLFQEIENTMFGVDHASISATLARRWNLPDRFVKVIEYHHQPGRVSKDMRVMAFAVHAADAVMMMMGIGLGIDGLQYPLDPETIRILKLRESSFDDLVSRVLPFIEEAEVFLKCDFRKENVY